MNALNLLSYVYKVLIGYYRTQPLHNTICLRPEWHAVLAPHLSSVASLLDHCFIVHFDMHHVVLALNFQINLVSLRLSLIHPHQSLPHSPLNALFNPAPSIIHVLHLCPRCIRITPGAIARLHEHEVRTSSSHDIDDRGHAYPTVLVSRPSSVLLMGPGPIRTIV